MVEAPDPGAARGLEHGLGADHVGAEEATRVDDRERVVRLGGEVDDHLDSLVAQRLLGEPVVGDIALHERNVIRKALAVAGVGEQVEATTWSSGWRSSQ